MENKKEEYRWDLGRKIMWSLVIFFILFIVSISIVGTRMAEKEKQEKIEEMNQKQEEKAEREREETEKRQKYAVKGWDGFRGSNATDKYRARKVWNKIVWNEYYRGTDVAGNTLVICLTNKGAEAVSSAMAEGWGMIWYGMVGHRACRVILSYNYENLYEVIVDDDGKETTKMRD